MASGAFRDRGFTLEQLFYMISNPMAKLPRRKTKRRTPRVLLSMDGHGMRDGWVTFKLPAWFVALVVVAVVLVCVAVVASPELAAKLAALLTQLTQLPPSHRQ